MDFKASRATVLDPTLGQYRYVHFATHGILDMERPSLSALVPRPGSPFGQLVTILSSRAPCAMAGAGNVAATPAPALTRKLRRSMVTLPLFIGFLR